MGESVVLKTFSLNQLCFIMFSGQKTDVGGAESVEAGNVLSHLESYA